MTSFDTPSFSAVLFVERSGASSLREIFQKQQYTRPAAGSGPDVFSQCKPAGGAAAETPGTPQEDSDAPPPPVGAELLGNDPL